MNLLKKIISMFLYPNMQSERMILGVSIWIAVLSNFYLWMRIFGITENSDSYFVISFVFILIGLNVFSISLLAWGWMLKPILSIYVVSAAVGAYFMKAYGIVIDSNMITNILQTDFREASDLINSQMIAVILMLSAPPLWFVWRIRLHKSPLKKLVLRRLAMIFLGILLSVTSLLLSFQTFSSVMRNHKEIRYLINPYNSGYAIFKKIEDSLKKDSRGLVQIGEGSYIDSAKDPLVILIVGETARSDHFGINGYSRDTTPLLSKRNDIWSFNNAWSCGTSTAESLPCMFSHLGREDFFDRQENYENLLDVLKKADLNVVWIDNQSGCKGVCARVTTEIQKIIKDDVNCYDDGCFDAVVLDDLRSKIESPQENKNSKGTVVLIHQMGSHGPAYYKRSSSNRKSFFPECNSSALQTCSRDQVVNAYDNSIRETDYFISKTIDWVKETYPDRSTALIYVSDHGESLGEKNIYLHGLPYGFAPDAQKKIPWVVWFSENFKRDNLNKEGCSSFINVSSKINHDNYFHSVLGLLKVNSSLYNSDLDIFRMCRNR